ncbi:MAG: NrsF family protein [Polyangiaceae bacterium]
MMPPETDEPWNDIPDPFPHAPAPEPPPPPAERSLTRSQRAQRLAGAAGLSATWLVIFAAVLGFRPDLGNTPIAVQLAVWSVAVPLGLFVSLRPMEDGFPPKPRTVAAGLVALFAVFAGLVALPVTGSQAALSVATVKGCATVATVFALPPAVLAALVLRRGFVNAPALRGAVVGAVCGLSGAVGVHSHCVVVTASHVLVAHGLTVLAGALVGALLGRRFGRP